MTTEEFIKQYRQSDVNKVALLCHQYPQIDRVFALQQIEGWQKAKDKLPELSQVDGWWWPVRLSMEQCSSEQTALYKRKIVDLLMAEADTGERRLIDLTGGLGIDSYYMGATDYVEHNEQLCQIAQHNFQLVHREVRIHHQEAEEYLQDAHPASIIYLDPARRNEHGGKVFRLEDCSPNIESLYPILRDKAEHIIIKLSPMLDITEAMRSLPDVTEIHVVAVKNEVKEVLVVCSPRIEKTQDTHIQCVNLATDEPIWESSGESANAIMAQQIEEFLYEPNAAIMKAGLYKEISQRLGIKKLSENSHLYTSDQLLADFPGRRWRVQVVDKQSIRQIGRCNIICRNYPLKPEEVKKKYKLQDGGDKYLIGTRIGSQSIMLSGERV